MTMEIGDIVNITNSSGSYWKGEITLISVLSKPYATVNEINGRGHCVIPESKMIRKDGEWWEVKH